MKSRQGAHMMRVLQYARHEESKLDFLISLGPDEIKSLFKAGPKLIPLIERSYQVVNDHPEILPEIFDVEGFKRDYQAWKDLIPIVNLVKELASSLENTEMALKVTL